jgi:hypothetical protein
MRMIIAILTGLIFCAAAVIFIVGQLRQREKRQISATWPSTEARIIRSSIEEEERVAEKQRRYTVYKPHIEYSYSVNGQTYTNTTIDFADLAATHAERAKNLISQYPAGASTTVFYNPGHPAEAVLQRSGPDGR